MVVMVVMLVACNFLPLEGQDVHLTREEFDAYYEQLEIRWPRFFSAVCVSPPSQLPSGEELYNFMSFKEIPDDAHESCYYSVNRNTAVIGAGRWESGCVPHEIGHAACDLLGWDSWCREFEHPSYPSQCPVMPPARMFICHVDSVNKEHNLQLPVPLAKEHLRQHDKDYKGNCDGRTKQL